MRTPPERDQNRLFNNADSFGMQFDEAWKLLSARHPDATLSREEKLELVLNGLVDHPFAQSQPALARQVAEFRLRLFRQ
jgi:hypothetical protein